jgi:transcription initiation factor TFIID subunit TAF12
MGKMEASFVSFSQQHPHWTPDLQGSMFLDAAIRQQQLREQGQGQAGEGAGTSSTPAQLPHPAHASSTATTATTAPAPASGPSTGRTWAALHERGPSAFQDSRMRESGVFRLVDDLLQLHDKLLRGGG